MGLVFLLVSLSGFRISNNCIYQKVEFVSSTSKIKPGTEIDDLGDGFYKAKVEKQIDGFVNHEGTNWKVKTNKSTFFPDNWSVEKIQAEIAHAVSNMNLINSYSDGRKLFKGDMTNGTQVAIWENAEGIITSTYPLRN